MNEVIQSLIPRPLNVRNLGDSQRRIRKHFILNTHNTVVANIFNERLKKLLGFTLKVLPEYPRAKLNFIMEDGFDTEEYTLQIDDSIEIRASTHQGLLYGAYTLLQIIDLSENNLPKVEINDSPAMPYRGYYHDVTRGKIPTMESFKELIDLASFYKYNQFQFYIEHSFQFEGLEQVWFDKSPITAQDILELDEYAAQCGIDLIPSLTTFGHMYEILRTAKYKALCERWEPDKKPYNLIDRMAHHTLNIFDEEAFQLVCKMIDQYMPLFRSQYFNICCDETFDLCSEKNKDRVGCREDKFRFYCDFVLRIYNYVKSKGKQVMMWNDILLEGDMSGMPRDIIYLDWDYSPQPSEENRKRMAQMPNVSVCSGTSSWNVLIPQYEQMFQNCDSLCTMAMKYGIKGYYLTCWGDFGDILKHSLHDIPIAYSGAISWEGRPRDNKEAFLADLGWIARKDRQLYGLLMEISKYHIVNWFHLVYALDEENLLRNGVDKRIVHLAEQQEKIDYAKLSILEEILYSKLVSAQDKDFILEILNICEGIRLFNAFDLQSCQFHDSMDKLARFWYEYCQWQRRYHREAELMRATEVIRGLMQKFRSVKDTKEAQ